MYKIWAYVSSIGTEDKAILEERQIIRLSNQVAIIFSLVAFPYFFIFRHANLIFSGNLVLVFVFWFASSIFFNKFKLYYLAVLNTVLCGTVAISYYACILSKAASAQYILIPLLILPLILIFSDNKISLLAFSFIPITCSLVLEYSEYSLFPQLLFDVEAIKFISISAQISTFIIVLMIFYYFYNSFYHKQKQLIESNSKLENTITQLTQETQDKEAALIREHKKAEKIKAQAKKIKTHALEIQEKQVQEKLLKQAGNYQQLLFQESIPQPHNQTITVFGSASHFITGDYRYIAQITDYISGLIVLDVTGHGAPAAMMTGILSKDVDCLFETSSPDLLTDTGATMKVLNKTFTRERRLSKLIAGVYAVVDTQQNLVHVTCAGSETAMIYRDGKIISIKNSNESLRMDEDSDFTSVTLPIQSGDIIIVCSDGLMDRKLNDGSPLFLAVEAEGDYDEEAGEYPEILLDYTQFEAILSKWPQKEALAEYLGETLDQLCRPASDDMTIIAVEIA